MQPMRQNILPEQKSRYTDMTFVSMPLENLLRKHHCFAPLFLSILGLSDIKKIKLVLDHLKSHLEYSKIIIKQFDLRRYLHLR